MALRSCAVYMLLPLAGYSQPSRGEATCANCHPKQAMHFSESAMFRALLAPRQTPVLKRAQPLMFRDAPYDYTISDKGGVATYRVTDGKTTLSLPILWSFGAGRSGQTYIYADGDQLFESRVSYYARIDGLDLTLGAAGSAPTSLETAAGRKMQKHDVAECFGCHSTGGGTGNQFQIARMKPGVQCEACHPGAEQHGSSAAKAGVRSSIPAALGKLTAEETSNLCGQCHRTWEQISINGPKGVANVRFQPYRLTNSKCYDAEDRRISCVACHDPHTPLETRTQAYDSACKSCHSPESTSPAAAHICKVASSGCAGCHMPKYEIPGSHMVFSDHQIRIAKSKEDYPN